MTADGKKKLEELVADLRSQNRCYQCNCIACGREGMGELHDHICTGEEGCKKTARKLDARRRVLQMKCVEAANALRSISDAYKAMEAERDELRSLIALAHPVMRDCGWHLAIAAEPQGDGVLEAACTEIEDKFAAALAHTTGQEG